MAPATKAGQYTNAGYTKMVQHHEASKNPDSLDPIATHPAIIAKHQATIDHQQMIARGKMVGQIVDAVAGSAFVPEGAFSIGNAARSATRLDQALARDVAQFHAEGTNKAWAKLMAKQSQSLGKNTGGDGPIALKPQHHLPFKFAKESYKDPASRSENIEGYKYDSELSTEQEAVYANPKTKTAHVAHRGSKTTKDWTESDVQVALGQEGMGGRFKEGEEKMLEVRDKYDGHKVEGSGHSLGGSVVHNNTARFGDEEWYGAHTVFNAGTSPLGRGGIRRVFEPNAAIKNSKVTNIRQKNDFVSWNPAPYGKTEVVDTASHWVEAHPLSSFHEGPLPETSMRAARSAAKQLGSANQLLVDAVGGTATKPTASTNIYSPRKYYPDKGVLPAGERPHKGVLPIQPKQYIRHHDYKISFLQQPKRPRQHHTHITGIRFG